MITFKIKDIFFKDCSCSHKPNRRLLKTIKDADSGKDVKKYKDVEDLFKKLGI